MKKYGYEKKEDELSEKTAVEKSLCPKCGANPGGWPPVCPNCGSEPFEEQPDGER